MGFFQPWGELELWGWRVGVGLVWVICKTEDGSINIFSWLNGELSREADSCRSYRLLTAVVSKGTGTEIRYFIKFHRGKSISIWVFPDQFWTIYCGVTVDWWRVMNLAIDGNVISQLIAIEAVIIKKEKKKRKADRKNIFELPFTSLQNKLNSQTKCIELVYQVKFTVSEEPK